MPGTKNSDAEIIIAQNKEEWNRLLFLLGDPEPNVFWINCDTPLLRRPLHDAVAEYFPTLKPYDIYVSEKTESLTRIILWEDKDKIPEGAIIHIFGMEYAVKSVDFLGNVNFQRDSLFRRTPAHIIFWADFDTGTVLTRKAYDFWSWIVFTFDFNMPKELLTARQRGFEPQLILQDTTIQLPHKDSKARIQHLEDEWEEFLKSVNGKPSTIKQMKDAIAIAMALAKECRDEGKYKKAIDILNGLLLLNPDMVTENDKGLVWNELGLEYNKVEDYGNAKKALENALNVVTKIYGEDSLNSATVHSNLAISHLGLGDLENAKNLLKRAIEIYTIVHYDNHPHKVRDETNLATVYLHLKEYDKAKELLEEAMKFYLKSYGADSTNLATIYSNLSVTHMKSGDLEKAKQLLEKAININTINFGEYHPKLAPQYGNIARLFFQLDDIGMARLYMRKAYELFKDSLGESNYKTQDALAFLQTLEQKGT